MFSFSKSFFDGLHFVASIILSKVFHEKTLLKIDRSGFLTEKPYADNALCSSKSFAKIVRKFGHFSDISRRWQTVARRHFGSRLE